MNDEKLHEILEKQNKKPSKLGTGGGEVTLQETKEQLESLRQHCSEMARGGDEIWENDVKALEKAIELVDKEAGGAYDR